MNGVRQSSHRAIVAFTAAQHHQEVLCRLVYSCQT
jgi:hypothetical protein